jgi:hypothetical protein
VANPKGPPPTRQLLPLLLLLHQAVLRLQSLLPLLLPELLPPLLLLLLPLNLHHQPQRH